MKTSKTIRALLVATGLLLVQGTASASALYEGVIAYNKGQYDKAYSLWEPLAKQGDHRAQVNMAMMYSSGKGVPQSDIEAAKWYKKAADQGNEYAALHLK
jgi:TPR repeat protein